MKKRLLLLLVSIALIPLSLAAQNIAVNGNVKDAAGEPVIGATVKVVGQTNIGTATDTNGNFALTVPADAKELEVSFVGMIPQTLPIVKGKAISVVLKEDAELLDEVVMVGYGSVKKSDLTGSVGSVKSEAIASKGVTSVMESLQGQIAGVNISASSSRAGESLDIQIRGKSTLGSSTSPLYVIDGVVCDDMDFLNPMDIEKIDILKDASSTAIYGSRATNGVVQITTKRGEGAMKTTLSYDGYYGIKTVANMPEFMDGYEFMQYRFFRYLTSKYNSDGTTTWTMSDANYRNVWGASSIVTQNMYINDDYTDWIPLVTRNGSQQNHFVNVTGNAKNMTYRVAAGFQDEQGVMYDAYRRFNLKGALDHKISDKLATGFSANMAYSWRDNASQKSVNTGYMMAPIMPAYYWEGDNAGEPIPQPAKDAVVYPNGGGPTSTYNPILDRENTDDEYTTFTAMANLFLQYKPIKEVTLKTTFSPLYRNTQHGTFYTGQTETRRDKGTNQMEDETFKRFSWTWDTQANFEKSWGQHKLSVLGLFSAYQFERSTTDIKETNMPFDVQWYNWGAGTIESANSDWQKITMLSWVARINYSFADRYLLTVSSRWDGSSKFAEENRWGMFPSAAFAWRANQEEFLKEADWLSNLKLRLSYGLTGNNASIGAYDTQANADVKYYYNFGSTVANGYGYNMSNANLKWEKTSEFNVGVDFGFLNNRISGSIDYYYRDSRDLLMDMKTPIELGSSSGTLVDNVGRVSNEGIEVMLSTVNVATKDWRWVTNFTFAHNKNTIRELSSGVTEDIGNKWFVGQPIDVVYGYEMAGVVDAARAQEIFNDPNWKTKFYEGEMELVDQNNDGVIDAKDKVVQGHASPDWTGSFTSILTYKGFDFTVGLYASVGGKVYSPFMREFTRYGSRGTQHLKMDFYIPDGAPILAEPDVLETIDNGDGKSGFQNNENIIAKQQGTHYGEYPYPTSTNGNGQGSILGGVDNADNPLYFVDNTYVRIKNITFGYTFPKRILGNVGLRIYANILNPFTFTSYKGFDPEWAGSSVMDGRGGVSSRTYQFGVNLKF